MSDPELSQSPLLVYPGAWIASVETFVNTLISNTPPLAARADTDSAMLGKLIAFLRRHYPHKVNAVHYLEQLAGIQPRQRGRVEPLTFLDAGPRRMLVPRVEVHPIPEGVTPHVLEVKFRPQRG